MLNGDACRTEALTTNSLLDPVSPSPVSTKPLTRFCITPWRSIIDARVAADPNVRQRFLRAAAAAARLRHPHVAWVYPMKRKSFCIGIIDFNAIIDYDHLVKTGKPNTQ